MKGTILFLKKRLPHGNATVRRRGASQLSTLIRHADTKAKKPERHREMYYGDLQAY